MIELSSFFSSRRRHTRYWRDWSSDVCSSDLALNTDFIDNSAGVDTSDREVNLKVLLTGVPRAERDAVLRSVEDEVAAAVLADNALQARALSVCAAQAPFLLDRHAQLIGDLERHGLRSEEHTSELQSR